MVGAPLEDGAAGADQGAVHVWTLSGTTWSETARLVAGDAAAGASFGASVALSDAGDTLVVGAPGDGALGAGSGAAYVFARAGTSWTEQQKLVASDGQAGDGLGAAVALDGGTILVGAPGADAGASDAGAAYVFTMNGSGWSEQAKLTASTRAADDRLSASVALDGDTAVCGAPAEIAHGSAGTAFVFARSGATWAEEARLDAAGVDVGDELGRGVAVAGDLVLVGAPRHDTEWALFTGAVYAFARDGTTWAQEDELVHSLQRPSNGFGRSIALDGERALIGAPGGFDTGSALVFERAGTVWVETGLVRRGEGASLGDELGTAVALAGDVALCGVPGSDEPAGAGAGTVLAYELLDVPRPPTRFAEQPFAREGTRDDFGQALAVDASSPTPTLVVGESQRAFVFERGSSGWAETEELVPSLIAPFDDFGSAVSVDDGTALVGAPFGGPLVHGQAFVFVRGGTGWVEQARLEAPDGGSNDAFGAAVAVRGDSALVGAPKDDTTGGLLSGSAYLFARSGTSWTFVRKVRASDGGEAEAFGSAVVLSAGPSPSTAVVASSTGLYVFERAGGAWPETAKLVPSDGASFFDSLALDGDTLVAGSTSADGFLPRSGAAYVFGRGGTTWTETDKLAPVDGLGLFGRGLALAGDLLVVGALAAHGPPPGAGAAYVYARAGGAWSVVHRLEPVAGELSGHFGWSCALNGTEALVGERVEGGRVHAVETAGTIRLSFCDASDGALEACPCANPGAPDTGCDLQQETGGVRLDVVAQGAALPNRATAQATGFPPGASPPAVLLRAPSLDPACPVVFGDGLRCVGVPLARLAATFASGGTSVHTFGHGPLVGTGTFYYQVWFRNQPAMYCTPDAFNLSSGRTIDW